MWTKLLWCLCTEGRRAGFLSWWTWNLLPLASALVTRFRQTKKTRPSFCAPVKSIIILDVPASRLVAPDTTVGCRLWVRFVPAVFQILYIYIYADFFWNSKQLSCLIINVNKLTDRQMSMCVYWVRALLGPNVGRPLCYRSILPPPPPSVCGRNVIQVLQPY